MVQSQYVGAVFHGKKDAEEQGYVADYETVDHVNNAGLIRRSSLTRVDSAVNPEKLVASMNVLGIPTHHLLA
jgi:hypothetical protein